MLFLRAEEHVARSDGFLSQKKTQKKNKEKSC